MTYAEQFERDGYTVARGLFTRAEMAEFIAECHSFESRQDPRAEPNSKGAMQFYSELFRRSARVREFLTQPALIDFVRPIAGPGFWLRWDQAVAKNPGAGVFPWHSDAGYNRLPQAHFEIWIGLSQSRRDNGGLCVIPGSHRQRHRHRFIDNHMVVDQTDLHDADERRVWVEADVGDVILFSADLMHKTYENVATDARWAYVAEVLRLSDWDPTIVPPYFVMARDGRPVGRFEPQLACARDPLQVARTLPLLLRKRVAGPVLRRVRAVLRPGTA